MFTTFGNNHYAQHVLSPAVEAALAHARAREIPERGLICSVSSGADLGATTRLRPLRPPLLQHLNP
jgi:hypothetical protein